MPPSNEEALFLLAHAKPAAERAAFLDRECGEGQSPARQRLDALLAAQEQSGGILADGPSPLGVPPSGGPATRPAQAGTPNAPAAKVTIQLEPAEPPDEAVGQILGRYKLRERVGEGGCGVVYAAEPTEAVRRRVPLKVVKLGMDTRQVIARCEAGRQPLARMDPQPQQLKATGPGCRERRRRPRTKCLPFDSAGPNRCLEMKKARPGVLALDRAEPDFR